MSAARHSQYPRNPLHAGDLFRGFHGSPFCYGLPDCSTPCTDLTGFPANGAFYLQAFSGSVALPAAGYHYNSDWTPLLMGLAPIGTAASLAAPHAIGREPHPSHGITCFDGQYRSAKGST